MNYQMSTTNSHNSITNYNCAMSALSEFLLEEFRSWERRTRRRQSVAAWARVLEVSQPSLTRWMHDDAPPSYENAVKLADKLGPKIYDLTGFEPPIKHEDLYELQKKLDAVSPEKREQLIREFLDTISKVIEQGNIE